MNYAQFVYRLSAFAVGLALVAVTTLGSASAARAAGTRDITVQFLDTVTVSDLTAFTVDSTTQRAYALAGTSVIAYDTSGPTFTQIARIPTGLPKPFSMAIDETTHRLVVGDVTPAGDLALIDVDPASSKVNTVLNIVPTGGDGAFDLAIDHEVIYVGLWISSDEVIRIDLKDGSRTRYTTAKGAKPIAIDRATHVAYIGANAAKAVVEISADGTTSSHPIDAEPTALAMAGRDLIVSSGTRVSKYNLDTWKIAAISPAIAPSGAFQSTVALDESSGTIYVPDKNSLGIAMLDLSTLAYEGTVSSANFEVATDPVSHRLFGFNVATGKIDMHSTEPTTPRISGADRFEVSAAISQRSFSQNVPVAFIASGAVFSDALSASAAAGATGGPVLLVQKDAIPAAIAAELDRLKPKRLVVMGGIATIDASVEAALKSYSPTVTRIGGADRYEVSANISHDTFGISRPIVYIATGASYADALSGSAAAGKLGGPVLLVTRDNVPDPIVAELKRLAPAKIVVLGGTASISDAVITSLKTIQTDTTRVSGADRFEVSAGVSHAAFPLGAKTVYVASGLTYPDALSGSVAAITQGAPVLLLSTDQVPASVATELRSLKPSQIVLLGGPNTLAISLQNELKSFIVN